MDSIFYVFSSLSEENTINKNLGVLCASSERSERAVIYLSSMA